MNYITYYLRKKENFERKAQENCKLSGRNQFFISIMKDMLYNVKKISQ